MRKFLKVMVVLVILGVVLAGCLSDGVRASLRSLFYDVKDGVSSAVDSIKSEVEDVLSSRESQLSSADDGSEDPFFGWESSQSSSSREEETLTELASLARYFPDGSYFTVDAAPCVHTQEGTVCENGSCRYESVVQALAGEVWWSKISPADDWDCAVPEAMGSEAFARFLYHALRGAELPAEAVPVKTYEIGDLASVSGMAGDLEAGDLLHFTGPNEHWAMFLESNGVNLYLYEANLDGCEGISYNRATAYESLISRFAGETVEVYR